LMLEPICGKLWAAREDKNTLKPIPPASNIIKFSLRPTNLPETL